MMRRYRPRQNSLALQIVVVLLTMIAAVPLYLLLINLFKSTAEIKASPLGIPRVFSFESMRYALTDPYKSIWKLYLNTLLITLGGTALSITLGAMVAYYIARAENRFAAFLRNYFLVGLMIPYILVYVPLAMILRVLGMMGGGVPVMILVYTSSTISFGVFIYTGFIRGLPRGMEESAAIDGANGLQIFWRIVFPLLKPTTAAVAIFIGVAMWNDYLTPMLLGGGLETITIGIYNAIGVHTTDWSIVFTYVFLACLPLVTVFLCLQKSFIDGLTSGAMKG